MHKPDKHNTPTAPFVKPRHVLPFRHGLWLAAVLALVLLPLSTHAQESTGVITGRVMNQATGRYLANAVVTVDGTDLRALTDDLGAYRLSNLAPGAYTVRAQYTDLDAGATGVTVASGETATADFSLTSNVYILEAFTVSGEREGAAKALQDQRFASTMKNVVAADAFGNMVDGNVGELMKKLPGVAIDYSNGEDPTRIRIRGMDPQMASITLDGNPIASGGGGTSRALDLSSFAVQNIDVIEVNFAPTPDQSANSMGGSVNFKTKNAFAQKGRRVRLDGNLSLNTAALDIKKTPGGNRTSDRKIKPGFMLQYTEAFGSVRPIGISIVANFFQKYRQNNNYDVPYSFNLTSEENGIASKASDGTIGNVTWTERGSATERRNLNINLDWKLSDNTSVFLRTAYTQDLGIGQYSHLFRAEAGTHLGATDDRPASNFEQIVGRNSTARAYSGLSNGDIKLWNVAIGAQHKFGRFEIDYDAYASQSKSDRDPSENFELRYLQNGINLSVYDVSGQASGEIRQTDAAGVVLPRDQWTYLDISKYKNLGIWQDFNYGSDDQMGAKFNVSFPLTVSNMAGTTSFPVKIKAGASFNQQKRDTKRYWKEIRLTGNSQDSAFGSAAEPTLQQFADTIYGNTWRGFDLAVPQWLSPYAVYDYFLANPGQFYDRRVEFGNKGAYLPESEFGREKSGDKQARERVFAGYIMATANVSNLTILAGVRYEATWLTGWGNIYLRAERSAEDPYAVGGNFDVVTPTSPYYRWDIERPYELAELQYRAAKRDYDYDKIFPNLQFKYDIMPNLIARASFTTGIGRPRLEDVVWIGNDDIVPAFKLIRRPNPNLRPQTYNLYQARLEYYFNKFGSATITGFYQPYKNYIMNTDHYEPYTFTTEEGEEVTELWKVSQNNNAGDGRNYGVELSYQQRLGFIASWLDRVEFYASISICDPKAKYPWRASAATAVDDAAAEEFNNLPPEWKDVPLNDIKRRFGTASLSYNGSRFGASVTAMWTDDYARSVDTTNLSETRYAENIRLDFSMNYKLSRHWQAYFDWRNFNDVPDERTIFDRTAGYYVSGMVINVGVRADF
ncbi:MAG: TonB-dependent receptor [Opitutaceae bacterium]|jgi:TonB-dependent receptor|nr:TonB-dependent receptor [Opitutaceae bacterium]